MMDRPVNSEPGSTGVRSGGCALQDDRVSLAATTDHGGTLMTKGGALEAFPCRSAARSEMAGLQGDGQQEIVVLRTSAAWHCGVLGVMPS
jgi:hypothetical protein